MKIDYEVLFKAVGGIVSALVAIILLQIWVHPLGTLVFWKILVSLALLGGLAAFFIAIKQDISTEKKSKDEKYFN